MVKCEQLFCNSMSPNSNGYLFYNSCYYFKFFFKRYLFFTARLEEEKKRTIINNQFVRRVLKIGVYRGDTITDDGQVYHGPESTDRAVV